MACTGHHEYQRRMRWAGHVACVGENTYRILVEKHEENDYLELSGVKTYDNIKISLKYCLRLRTAMF